MVKQGRKGSSRTRLIDMWSINGIYAFHSAANPPAEVELIATRDHMSARGPDGAGLMWSEDRRCGIAHHLLLILDLVKSIAIYNRARWEYWAFTAPGFTAVSVFQKLIRDRRLPHATVELIVRLGILLRGGDEVSLRRLVKRRPCLHHECGLI